MFNVYNSCNDPEHDQSFGVSQGQNHKTKKEKKKGWTLYSDYHETLDVRVSY